MMENDLITTKLHHLIKHELPLFQKGDYAKRLESIIDVGRMDLTLAKLAEAHWDAISILSEAEKKINVNSIYAVWASEIPGKTLDVCQVDNNHWTLSGTKMFCSGAGIVSRALITAGDMMIDLDLSETNAPYFEISNSQWKTAAFKDTKTATIFFKNCPFTHEEIIGKSQWYVAREGFWPGALGPAACWAGGAIGLVDYAKTNPRSDSHTLAHLAAMESNTWAMRAILQKAGHEVNCGTSNHHELALKVRHLIEQLSTDVLTRFARAYGPYPLACDELIGRRYQELALFLRQNHAERDLEHLGNLIKSQK